MFRLCLIFVIAAILFGLLGGIGSIFIILAKGAVVVAVFSFLIGLAMVLFGMN